MTHPLDRSEKSEVANLTCVRINGFAQLSTGSRSQELINALEHADFIQKGILSSWKVYNIKIKGNAKFRCKLKMHITY